MTGHDCTIFFLPGLGFDSASAAPIAAALGVRFRVVGIDLPGHGPAPDAANGSVHALTNAALTAIEAEADGGPWLLVAHSMGGKVGSLVAARVLSGHERVFGLAGSVLLAPSPTTPEPMDGAKRALLL
ncbi:MAG: alpha/beta fold hydrolase, partial [Salinibacterium sp.]|nr:alpha/beta fold hydrolase [Salinibacterium sp.]